MPKPSTEASSGKTAAGSHGGGPAALHAHTALYRKYRPHTFSDILGQDHIVSVLEGSIASGKTAHAYLFCGSRGTGKTSIARILSRELGTSTDDLYEIDAASNRGIDDIRELREAVHTLPFTSKYKVYIIDEVHMLTKEAFNALLKTLEEPPAHVVFMLATTELEKLPETIISRCQVFNFKKPSQQILRDAVLAIAEKEGYDLPVAGAEMIALLGDGSFRDTEGMLQKVLSSVSGKKISVEDVERVAGAPKGTLVNSFISSVVSKDLNAGMLAVSEAAAGNIDARLFLKLVLHKIRAVILLRFAPEMGQKLAAEFSESDAMFLKGLAVRKDSNLSSKTIEELLRAGETASKAYVPELPLELALLRIIGQDS